MCVSVSEWVCVCVSECVWVCGWVWVNMQMICGDLGRASDYDDFHVVYHLCHRLELLLGESARGRALLLPDILVMDRRKSLDNINYNNYHDNHFGEENWIY